MVEVNYLPIILPRKPFLERADLKRLNLTRALFDFLFEFYIDLHGLVLYMG